MEVIKDAIDPYLLRALYACWPDESWRGWHRYNDKHANKYGSRSPKDLPSPAMPCIMQMIEAVTDCVDIPNYCFPDLELPGAGLHMLPSGGYLRRHLDSSFMDSTGWKREYSCVLGVSPEWDCMTDGGEFILNETSVDPEFNQLVVFRTTETSYHEVLEVTGLRSRLSLCVFYWSEEEPTDPTRDKARFFN